DRATFTVRLSEPSSQPERVVISTVAETATLGKDYIFQNDQQLLFAPGVTSRQFTINTLSDSIREGIETLRIIATPGNRPAAQQIVTRASIYDLVPTSVSVSDIRVTEGSDGTTNADFTVRLTAGALLPVTLRYATQDGTATAGTDYTATSGTLTFAPGEYAKTVSVPILGDRIAETDETFKLLLSNPSRGTTIRTPQATCTIVNDEPDQVGFQVTLKYLDGPNGPVPQAVRTVAQQAVNRWARIITGDVPGVTVNGVFLDDFEMSIQMGLLGGSPTDGPSNGLANAGPTAFRDNGAGLPYAGITGIDPADAGDLTQLYDTITHEMGHAFGFTDGAQVFSRWIVGETFTGPNALREYTSIFAVAATGVPLQAGVRAHWDEPVFGNELMTPFTTGAPEYISRITIGALQDMGYTVDYAAAEPYVRPGARTQQLAAATGVTTVSAFAGGSVQTPAAKPAQAPVQAKPPVVAVQAAPVNAVAAAKPVVVLGAGTTGTLMVVPPKPGDVVTLLSRTGVLGG
ncbi:MAG: hypothetical protein EBZ59_07765, partial [Planctomycetia bacterium]|nr:hypothetical protein [Planctomycetia bacterium]